MNMQQEYETFLDAVYWNEKKLVLFGAGANTGYLLENYLPKSDVAFIVDNNKRKHGATIYGLQVLHPDILRTASDDYCVLITVNYYTGKITEQLSRMGIKHIIAYNLIRSMWSSHLNPIWQPVSSPPMHHLSVVRCNMHAYKAHFNEIECVRKLLSDNLSEVTFDACLQKRKYNYGIFYDIEQHLERQYFPVDIFKLSDNEVFVDAGAFDGADTVEFIRRVRGIFRKCILFEPDPDSFEKLKCKAGFQFENRFNIYPFGLSDTKKIASFDSLATMSSSIQVDGDVEVKLTNLDSVVDDEQVTFIKMDIEGEELNALYGAKQVIRRDKPKLAISIYHKFSHYWEIPLYIKSLVPEYKFFIRHYHCAMYDTVLYCCLEQDLRSHNSKTKNKSVLC